LLLLFFSIDGASRLLFTWRRLFVRQVLHGHAVHAVRQPNLITVAPTTGKANINPTLSKIV